MMSTHGLPPAQGLYDPAQEHDSCGFGFVVDIEGRRSHHIVKSALDVLLNLEHRGASGSEKNTGDGAGILLQIPHAFLAGAVRGFRLPAAGRYAVGAMFRCWAGATSRRMPPPWAARPARRSR